MGDTVDRSPEFNKMLAGDPRPDLAIIALEIALDVTPNLDVEHYARWIDELAGRIRDRCPTGSDPTKVLGQINWAMFVEEGFRGNRDEYYDPRNSYLNEVIDRKTGIPITLCILYSSVARRLGVELVGVSLPAHFMLKVGGSGRPLFVDAFNGDIIDREGCERRLSELLQSRVTLSDDQIAACPPRLVIGRVLRNLKAIHLQAGDLPSALIVQRRVAAALADEPDERRDLGMLCLQLGRLDDAVSSLQEYLHSRADAVDAASIRGLLRDAGREIALRN